MSWSTSSKTRRSASIGCSPPWSRVGKPAAATLSSRSATPCSRSTGSGTPTCANFSPRPPKASSIGRCRRLRLNSNFRSDKHLIGWCNTIFADLFGEQTDPVHGAVAFHEAVPGFDAAPGQSQAGVRIEICIAEPDTQARAQGEVVADRVEALLAADPPASIAVLVRARAPCSTTCCRCGDVAVSLGVVRTSNPWSMNRSYATLRRSPKCCSFRTTHVRRKEPSAREREGRAPRKKEPSAGEREGPAPRKKEPSAGEREGPAPRTRCHGSRCCGRHWWALSFLTSSGSPSPAYRAMAAVYRSRDAPAGGVLARCLPRINARRNHAPVWNASGCGSAAPMRTGTRRPAASASPTRSSSSSC